MFPGDLPPVVAQHQSAGTDGVKIFAFGFGLWKHGFVRAYLPGARVCYCFNALDARARGIDSNAKLLVWGVREREDVRTLSQKLGIPIWRMEDGFLRSVGLGSDFNVPASLVVDTRGIYFDPNHPSDLEHILETGEFSPSELERARALREAVVGHALSKYNFSENGIKLTRPRDAERVLLVPGQVEDDASIRLGCVDIRTNLQLLQEVRRQNPDAHIIFKPHPDLLSGNRKNGTIGREEALRWADQVITDVPLPMCLGVVDEVHTLTSLVGFEALLRGLRVVTYGRPFYAGWGLTSDRHTVSRRTRALSLDMLVAGVLIRYPRYLNRTAGALTTPEAVVQELREELAMRGNQVKLGRLQRHVRKITQAFKSILHGA